MTNRSSRNRSFHDSAFDGLMPLESRRMLDGAGMPSTDSVDPEAAEVILDGSPESDYENDIDETGDQAGSDSDLYSFTVRPTAERPRDTYEADDAGDDHDLYDFGQDRGAMIDDELAYETGEDTAAADAGPIIPVISGVPSEDEVAAGAEIEAPAAPLPENDGIVAIALIPSASTISWLGTAGDSGETAMPGDEGESPATWTDLSALPEPMLVAQS